MCLVRASPPLLTSTIPPAFKPSGEKPTRGTHELISKFKERTGCPVIVNTSFNVRGEPIVCTPEDAFACFMGTDMDALAIGNCLLRKEVQEPGLKRDHAHAFVAD